MAELEGSVEGGVEVYSSSEELQRHHAQVFADERAKEEEKKRLTDKERLVAMLDKYIDKHSSTVSVRKMAKTNENAKKYGADYQLDLSADIVEVLEKIKTDLR